MNRYLMKYALLVFAFLFSFLVSAKDFKVLDTSNGLPDNTVKCIAQDVQGFIWMGTFNGLCRFDGSEFKVYRHETEEYAQMKSNHVEALLSVEDSLWVGTQSGLNCLSLKDDRFYSCTYLTSSGEQREISASIQSILLCGNRLFVLTSVGQILVQKENLLFEVCDYGVNSSWLAVANYKDGLFWAYSSNGLYLLDTRTQRVINHYPSSARFVNNCVLYYSCNEETVYIGGGIGSVGEAFKVNPDMSLDKLSSFGLTDIKTITDYKGSVWFGTDGGGLVELKGKETISYVPQSCNISSDAVHSLFVDREDCLWIGTYRGGVNFYSSYYDWFHALRVEDGTLSHNVVTAIYPENDKIYIGLDGGGLNVYDKITGKTTVYNQRNSDIAGNNILSICGDQEYLWMAIYEKGLCRFSRRTLSFKTYDLVDKYKIYNANRIWDIRKDDGGNIWILGAAVYVFDIKKETFTLIDGVYNASGIVFDGMFIWISTRSGLYKLDRDTKQIKTHYYKNTKLNQVISSSIRYMFMDSNHCLWLSGLLGLYKLDEKNGIVMSYADRSELSGNKVVSIEEDSWGCLWIGTYNGLYKYNPINDSFIHFGKMDNLWAGEFNYHACAQDNDFIYMGSTRGLIWFNPKEIQYTHQTNPVYFTTLELLNQSGDKYPLYGTDRQCLPLSYDQNFFTIHFSVPEMLTPDKVQFSCFLEGFEKGWQMIGTKRQVSYTNVPPGEYSFYVKTTDSSGQWKEDISCLRIMITPPWWQTGWAWCLWILIGLVTIVAVFLFYKHELNIKHLVQLKEVEKDTARNINEAKLRFYTNITHELRTPIFLITAPLEELMAENKRMVTVSKSYLMSMYRNAMKLNKLVTRMIDLRKLEQGKLRLELHCQNVVAFCRDLVPDYEALCQQKNIIFHFLPEKTIIKLNFDAEKLEIILSNLISNAFKYTPEGGKIALVIEEAEAEVVFSIEDNGIGIKKEFKEMIFDRFFQIDSSQTVSAGDGIGLSFVKHLVELHGGQVHVESEPDKGAKFIFSIPMSNTLEEPFTDDVIAETSFKDSFKPVPELDRVFSPAATHTILLIDDEPEILELIERSLVEDFKVLKANNGQDGLTLAKKELPDLIICDVMMPKMDGMEFLSLLKSDKELAHIPVIMLTAKIAEEDQMTAFDSGADAYLTKPVSLKYLRNRIGHLLARAESVSVTNVLAKKEKTYTKEEQRFLLKCKETIDEYLMNPDLGVIFLAEKMGMSHSSFYRKIKAVTGMSGIDFINEYRIFKAVQLFDGGEINVSSVCVKCGFNDIKSFRDAFKKRMHVSPKQYVTRLSSGNHEE